MKENQINFLKEELSQLQIQEQLRNPLIQQKIQQYETNLKLHNCSTVPNAFWDRKQHIVCLPYEENFNDKNIPTKARPCQMNQRYLETCKQEIHDLQN